MIRKILFTTDFSVLSKKSLSYTAALARKVNASILGLHCLKLPNWLQDSSPDTRRELESLKAGYRHRLQEFFADPRLSGLQVETRLSVGIPEQVIRQTAIEDDIDLILAVKNSRTELERFFVGSVTEKILRESSTPVLVMPSQGEPTLRWSPIVCAVDFSETSKDALQFSIQMAQSYNSDLVVLHAIETQKEWKQLEQKARRQLETFEEKRTAELKGLAVQFGAGHRTRIRLEKGRPDDVLLQVVRELNSDLLIVGTRGHWVKKGMGTGSTVNTLIRNAELPVVAVPG